MGLAGNDSKAPFPVARIREIDYFTPERISSQRALSKPQISAGPGSLAALCDCPLFRIMPSFKRSHAGEPGKIVALNVSN